MEVFFDLPKSARTTGDENFIFNRLEQYNGINERTASTRLHQIKSRFGLRGDENVTFDYSGNVYDSGSGDLLGSLTQGGKAGGGRR